MFKRTFVCALLVMGLMVGTAQAGPITGFFDIYVYSGAGGGDSTLSQNQALDTNAFIVGSLGSLVAHVTWDGVIDFDLPSGYTPNTIQGFFDAAQAPGGTLTVLSGSTAGVLSQGQGNGETPFLWGSVFDIRGTTATPIGGKIYHDDGIGLYQGGSLVTDPNSAKPTSPIFTDFSLNAGDFRLIYVAANGMPEELTMDVTRVPDGGATLALLGCALVGLGALRRKFGA